jgi:hypothetical protein
VLTQLAQVPPADTPTAAPTDTPTAPPTPDREGTATAEVRGTQTAEAWAHAQATQTAIARATGVAKCLYDPHERFKDLWELQSYKPRLGCPVQKPIGAPFAEQYFERGFLLWSEEAGHLYLAIIADQMPQGRTWYTSRSQPVDWPYTPGLSCAPTPPAPGLLVPISGFGGLWCNRKDIQEALGYATAKEYQADDDLLQEFDNGFILLDSRKNRYILFKDDLSYVIEPG